jgi:hypothetical protein
MNSPLRVAMQQIAAGWKSSLEKESDRCQKAKSEPQTGRTDTVLCGQTHQSPNFALGDSTPHSKIVLGKYPKSIHTPSESIANQVRKILQNPWILEPSATELYVNRICTSLPSSLRIA